MGDKRIRIEKSNLDEGKQLTKINRVLQNLIFNLCTDMRLKAIEFVQQRMQRSSKF